jgi:NADPH2 dehydrogenase
VQFWALGRVADPSFAKVEGITVKAPSAIGLNAELAVLEEKTKENIQYFIADYVQAAKNAMEAGFDALRS